MIKHFIHITLRRLFQNKITLGVNITAFSIGISCALLSFIYVYHETSFERQHQKRSYIYRVTCVTNMNGNITEWAPAPAPLGPDLSGILPEITNYTRVMIPFFGNNFKASIEREENVFYTDKIFRVDSTFFEIFDFEILHGNTDKLLSSPENILISDKIAQIIFGKTDVLGMTLEINNYEFVVGGVIKKSPNTHLDFNVLIPWNAFDWEEDWLNADSYTYILLDEKVNLEEFERKLTDYADEYLSDIGKEIDAEVKLILQPLSEIYLHSNLHAEISANSNYNYILIFIFIGVLFILIATLNHINSAIASYSLRYKELGVKKAMGASIQEIKYQFVVEGFIFLLFSFFVSAILVVVLLPHFSDILNTDLSLTIMLRTEAIIGLLSFMLLVWLLITIYPLYFFSKFTANNLIRTQEQRTKNFGVTFVRKLLVSLQITVSVIVAILTLTIERQIHFISTKDLGFDEKNVVVVPLPSGTTQNIKHFKDELQNRSEIIAVSGSTYFPGISFKDEFRIDIEDDKQIITLQEIYMDYDNLKLLNIPIKQGRNFDVSRGSDYYEAFIVNEEAAKTFGWTTPVGKEIEAINDDKSGNVIGVIENVNLFSLHEKIEPLIIHLSSEDYSRDEIMYIRISENANEAIESIRNIFKGLYQSSAFNYFFLDDELMKLYRKEEKLGDALFIGLIIAIYLSCTGLYSLSYFLANRKIKEISVRKIYGATVNNLFTVQLKDYIVIVVVGNLIAWPLAYLLSRNFLDQFVYKVPINLLLFLLVSCGSILIIVLTIMMNIIKVNNANPSIILKSE